MTKDELKRYSLSDFENCHPSRRNALGVAESVKRTNGSIMARHGWCWSGAVVEDTISQITKELKL